MGEPVKNKKLTYLLICAVAGVWGIIVYQLFLKDRGEDFVPRTAMPKQKHEPYDQYLPKTDTFKLVLNYRDPFIDKMTSSIKESPVAVKTLPAIKPSIAAPPINWSSIRYTGRFVNPVSKKAVVIVTLNGKEQMMETGMVVDGVKLLKITLDSIMVSWQGNQKYIRQ